MGLSIGGLISYYFSSHIALDDLTPPKEIEGDKKKGLSKYLDLIKSQPTFVNFILKRFVFLTGAALAAPLFPLYFVREIKASDSWIATISVAQSAVMIIGYFFWSRQSKRRGSRAVLLWTTFGVALYPFLTAFTHKAWLIAIYAGVAGIFQAGLDLVFFDELMKAVPIEYSATFVSLAQGIQYISSIASPIIGSFLADSIGIGPGLIVSAAIRLTGFLLFLLPKIPARGKKTN
jgi:predicted MFS family arabinose efflux permease